MLLEYFLILSNEENNDSGKSNQELEILFQYFYMLRPISKLYVDTSEHKIIKQWVLPMMVMVWHIRYRSIIPLQEKLFSRVWSRETRTLWYKTENQLL